MIVLGRHFWFYHILVHHNLFSILVLCLVPQVPSKSLVGPLRTSEQCDYHCESGDTCFSRAQKCDLLNDCLDGSDEKNCDITCNQRDEIRCNDGKSCITNDWKCDGEYDCSDGSDELGCPAENENLVRVCDDSEVQCGENGFCIPHQWQCDGQEDCIDKSDESDELCHWSKQTKEHHLLPLPPPPNNSKILKWLGYYNSRNMCTVGYICSRPQNVHLTRGSSGNTDHLCIPRSYLCDGSFDCPEGDDEEDCQSLHNRWVGRDDQNSCDLNKGMLKCADSDICLSASQFCDGVIDCPDGSDEHLSTLTSEHTVNRSEKVRVVQKCRDWCDSTTNCSEASQHCLNTPKRAVCMCDNGYRKDDSSGKCVDVNECSEYGYGLCSQVCTNYIGSYDCSCHYGFKLDTSTGVCKNDPQLIPILIFSNRNEIRLKELESADRNHLASYHSIGVFNVTVTNDAVDVVFDDISGQIFWTAVAETRQGIASTNMNSRDFRYRHMPGGESYPEGLALDRSARNLYYTDFGSKHVAVLNIESGNWAVLIEGVEKPRSIDLHIRLGLMFFSDWSDDPGVWKASMDGSELIKVVHLEKGMWPNGLVLDKVMDKIYWAEVKTDSIHHSNLDGSEPVKIVAGPAMHPFSLALFEDTLYWSDWQSRSIMSCDKFTGKNQSVIVKESKLYPMGISIYSHPTSSSNVRQSFDDFNPCGYNFCTDVCVRNARQHHSCVCPPDSHLNRTNNRECVRPEVEIIDTDLEESQMFKEDENKTTSTKLRKIMSSVRKIAHEIEAELNGDEDEGNIDPNNTSSMPIRSRIIDHEMNETNFGLAVAIVVILTLGIVLGSIYCYRKYRPQKTDKKISQSATQMSSSSSSSTRMVSGVRTRPRRRSVANNNRQSGGGPLSTTHNRIAGYRFNPRMLDQNSSLKSVGGGGEEEMKDIIYQRPQMARMVRSKQQTSTTVSSALSPMLQSLQNGSGPPQHSTYVDTLYRNNMGYVPNPSILFGSNNDINNNNEDDRFKHLGHFDDNHLISRLQFGSGGDGTESRLLSKDMIPPPKLKINLNSGRGVHSSTSIINCSSSTYSGGSSSGGGGGEAPPRHESSLSSPDDDTFGSNIDDGEEEVEARNQQVDREHDKSKLIG